MLRAGVHGASLRRRTAHDIISHESDKCRTLEGCQLAITHPIDLSRRAVEGATHTSTATSAASSPSSLRRIPPTPNAYRGIVEKSAAPHVHAAGTFHKNGSSRLCTLTRPIREAPCNPGSGAHVQGGSCGASHLGPYSIECTVVNGHAALLRVGGVNCSSLQWKHK